MSGFAAHIVDRTGGNLTGLLYVSPCSTSGASSPDRPVSEFATDVWRTSGTLVELTDESASVQVGWRRVRRDGQEESSPEQSLTLTLKRGERHTLESIAFPASGSCEARNLSLDIVFSSQRELSGRSAGLHASAGAGTSAGLKPHSWAPREIPADLWLVRNTPGRPDETLHTVASITPMPVQVTYGFAPLTIQTASGTVSVKVEGTIEAGRAPDGERRLHFTVRRSVTAVTTARPGRDGKPVVEGSTKTTVTLPGPDEVLSFEMPPLRMPDGSTAPDRLSVRLRVTPSPMR